MFSTMLSDEFGETLTLRLPLSYTDEHLSPVEDEVKTVVLRGCLVSPYRTEDGEDGFELETMQVYRVYFPKAFKDSVANGECDYEGKTFKFVGEAMGWKVTAEMEHNRTVLMRCYL